jgi:hypothetical protein
MGNMRNINDNICNMQWTEEIESVYYNVCREFQYDAPTHFLASRVSYGSLPPLHPIGLSQTFFLLLKNHLHYRVK